MTDTDYQTGVAHHEAGHAVAAIATGHPIDYVTTIPDHDRMMAGHAMSTNHPGTQALGGDWQPEIIAAAAGMIAHDRWYRATHTRWGFIPHDWREDWVAPGGKPDLEEMRRLCRYVWHLHQDGHQLRPAIPADATVETVAVEAWRQAVRLVHRRWPAVRAVAAALAGGTTLTGGQVQQIVDGHPGHGRPPMAGELEFWPRRYSRMVWAPAGRARKRVAA